MDLKLNELTEFERSPREFMRHFSRLYTLKDKKRHLLTRRKRVNADKII